MRVCVGGFWRGGRRMPLLQNRGDGGGGGNKNGRKRREA